MSDTTKIQWTDHTFNPWIGCTKVSPGCAHCYADAQDKFRKWTPEGWGKGKPRQRTSAANWKQPLKWDREAQQFPFRCSVHGAMQYEDCPSCESGNHENRPRVFCASLADWLDDEVPIEWLADLLKLIHDTPNLDWQLLTKRPENAERRISAALKLIDVGTAMWTLGGLVPHNVWIGTSIEDQERADKRIPHLLKIPAKVRFLSVEPLLGLVELRFPQCENGETHPFPIIPPATEPTNQIHWVIVGGESGPDARDCTQDWIRSIVQQCNSAGVACFVKQLGSNVNLFHSRSGNPNDDILCQTVSGYPDDHYARLKDRKGGDMVEWPEDLRIRQFPS